MVRVIFTRVSIKFSIQKKPQIFTIRPLMLRFLYVPIIYHPITQYVQTRETFVVIRNHV